MKDVKYNKAFLPCAVFSIAVILFGIIGMLVRGINFGIDFVPGLVEEVKIAPAAIQVNYNGSADISVSTSNTALDLVITGAKSENETKSFAYGQYPTVADLAAALNTVEGVSASVLASASLNTYGIYIDSSVSAKLNPAKPYLIYVADKSKNVSIDEVRSALAGQNVSVKELGSADDRSFQIRAAITNDKVSSQELQEKILTALGNKFGKTDVAVVKTDFVGSGLSKNLAWKSVVLAIVTIFLIWGYASIRFHWDFALGAIIALLHDCLIMFAFISWTQVEFSTTTLAAVLTIFGYSINATVVILDRVRENIRLVQTRDFKDILNRSIGGTMSRSIITTVTTLFASISLLVFTTGSIRNFAVVLTVGLISGCYSSLFISSGAISIFRRNWEPGVWALHVRPHDNSSASE